MYETRQKEGDTLAHVVIVAPEELPIPPSQGGSVQIYLDGLVHTLQHTANDIALISPGKVVPQGFPVIHVNGPKGLYQKRVLKTLKHLSPDVVQIDNRPELILKVRRILPRTKLVLNLHSNTFLSKLYISPLHARQALRTADAVVVNSKYLRGWLQRNFQLASPDWHPVVIYPGIDTARFQRNTALRQNHSQSADASDTSDALESSDSLQQPLRILFVGRVIRQKGVHILLEAVKYLHKNLHMPISVTLVGRTPPWEKNYGRTIRLGLKGLPIRWVGFVPPIQLPRYYWNANILVCPSQWREAFGLVNVEAMAAGLPVIASDVGGIKEVVDETSGILVKDYHNPKAFADALLQLSRRPERIQQLSIGARKRANLFTWNQAAHQFQRLYESLT